MFVHVFGRNFRSKPWKMKKFSLHWAKWKRCLSWSLDKWCHLTGIRRYTVYLSGLKSLITSSLQPTSKSCDTLKTTFYSPEGLSSLLWNLGPVRTSLLHLGRRVKNGGTREGWLFFAMDFGKNETHRGSVKELFFLNYSRWFWQKVVIPQESDKHTGRPRSHITSQLCNSSHTYHNLLGPLVIHSNSHSHHGAWCLKAARRWIRLTLELLSAKLMVGGNCGLIGPEFIWWTKWKNGSKSSWLRFIFVWMSWTKHISSVTYFQWNFVDFPATATYTTRGHGVMEVVWEPSFEANLDSLGIFFGYHKSWRNLI